MPHFVKKYCKQDRRRETPKKTVKADEEGITDQLPKIGIKEKPIEMFKSCPGTTHDPLHDVEILEGQYNPIQWSIMEDGII
jgi:hypothetical protein